MKHRTEKAYQKLYENRLINLLETIADFCCQELGLEYKTFAKMVPQDPEHNTRTAAYCGPFGDIRIKLKCHKSRAYFNYRYLVDSVVHEVAHLKHNYHTKKFWKTHRALFRKVKQVFNVA